MARVRYANQGGRRMELEVCIDTQNIGHIDDKTISGLRIEAAFDAMEKYGYEAHAIFPSHLITGKKQKKKIIKNQDIIEKLISEKLISLVSNNDDKAIITNAYDNNRFILTNDRYENHKCENWCTPEIKKFLESKLIPFDFIEGKLSIPLDVRYRLNMQSKDPSISHMSIPDFKAHATNGGFSSDTSSEVFPAPVQKMLKLIQEKSDEIRLDAFGSQLKSVIGYTLNDLFGNIKHAARFLESLGYPIRYDKYHFYVRRIGA